MQAEQFSYCQSWMLAWGYRKQNLLKELLNYNADIMCLQAIHLHLSRYQVQHLTGVRNHAHKSNLCFFWLGEACWKAQACATLSCQL